MWSRAAPLGDLSAKFAVHQPAGDHLSQEAHVAGFAVLAVQAPGEAPKLAAIGDGVQEHPACYVQLETGELVVDRDPGDTLSGGRVIGPDSDVVATGCTSDIIVWWEATASLALTSAAIVAGLLLVPNDRREHWHRRANAA